MKTKIFSMKCRIALAVIAGVALLLFVWFSPKPLFASVDEVSITSIRLETEENDYNFPIDAQLEKGVLDILEKSKIYKAGTRDDSRFALDSTKPYLYILLRTNEDYIGIHIQEDCFITMDSLYYFMWDSEEILTELESFLLGSEFTTMKMEIDG